MRAASTRVGAVIAHDGAHTLRGGIVVVEGKRTQTHVDGCEVGGKGDVNKEKGETFFLLPVHPPSTLHSHAAAGAVKLIHSKELNTNYVIFE